jgi:hypothetical protein
MKKRFIKTHYSLKINLIMKPIILGFVVCSLCLLTNRAYSQTTLGNITTSSSSCSFSTIVCEGDTVQFTPSNTTDFTNFKWYFNSVSGANEITGINTSQHVVYVNGSTIRIVYPGGRYIMTGEYSTPSGCSAQNDTFDINFNPKPAANPASMTVCESTAGSGQAIFDLTTLNATVKGGATDVTLTYHATLAEAQSGSNALNMSSYTSVATTIYARVTNIATNCYNTSAISLNIYTKPVIADASTTICNGATVDLTSLITSYATYSNPVWALTTAGGTAVSTPTAVTPSVTTTYVLVAENGSGCKDTANVVVTVNPKPVIADASTTICDGTTIDLTSLITSYATYSNPVWALTTAGGTAVSTPTAVTPSVTTTYVLVAENGSGCKDTANVVVTVNPKPVIADASTTICNGATVDLTSLITSYATYSNPVWALTTAGGTAVSTPSAVTPSVTTTYVLVAENGSGCKDTANVVVTVNPKPVIADASTTICNGATVDLTSLITSYGSYSNPVWALTTAGGTAVSTPTAVTPSVTTTYVLVAENGSGCKDTANVVVTVNPKPVIADASTTICDGTTVDLTSLITSYASYSNPVWALTTAGGTAVSTPTAVTPSVTTTYVLVAENGSGCKDTANVVVTVNPKPVIADASTTICDGTTVDLTSLITSYATYSNPVWTIGTVSGSVVTAPTLVTTSSTMTFVLVAENGSGCKDTANVLVTVNPKPNFTLAKPVACPGTSEDVVIMNLTGAVAATSTYKVDAGVYAAYPSPANITGLSVGNHTITVKNTEGCETAKPITINAVAPKICLPVTVTRIN